ncbi:MAG: indolepyruvate ferredoxin oxidoreductase subunit alpha, partial [Clostridia bacterium]|nr:indolepyruvate ferredoxin oxidoreductase subunit alpha [Clostridia bacterium]
MAVEFLMGNEAIALGALDAGVNLVAGYPGTPSSEILETVARRREAENPDVYVEWSVNEKAALEVAAGASYAGARTLVTMKQVGLNVASDPLMSLAYVGVKGGMVIVSADDPGPISSQTEQDTRTFAGFAKLPVFDPASPEEAYRMIGDAFALS